MKYLSSSDSLFSRVGGKLVNLVMLNVIFILTCIPIITIGVSITALFSVTMKMVNDRTDTGLVKLYFKAWKANFVRGLELGFIQICLTVLLILLVNLLKVITGIHFIFAGIGVLLAALFYGILFSYLYAYTARYNDSVWNSLKVSIQMGLIKWRQTLAILVTVVASALIFTSNGTFLALGLMLFTAFGFSGLAYLGTPVEMDVFTSFESHVEEAKPDKPEPPVTHPASPAEARLLGK